jgi:hypothetical protein
MDRGQEGQNQVPKPKEGQHNDSISSPAEAERGVDERLLGPPAPIRVSRS